MGLGISTKLHKKDNGTQNNIQLRPEVRYYFKEKTVLSGFYVGLLGSIARSSSQRDTPIPVFDRSGSGKTVSFIGGVGESYFIKPTIGYQYLLKRGFNFNVGLGFGPEFNRHKFTFKEYEQEWQRNATKFDFSLYAKVGYVF